MEAPSKEVVYLFLFSPQVEFANGHFTVTNPEDSEKYYWSFDPAGLDWLSHEQAEDLGLPTPQFSVYVSGYDVSGFDRDKSTVDMIREFHAAKGFDPDSQDATIAMEYPLVDIEAIKNSVQKLTRQSSLTGPDTDKVEDEIYYSLGLC
ncbi:hypothetical protein B0H19DRAFT_1276836 [Mycena capillaripes]|nr:hypothetical protein B0H19DRAFT_1276836 [Mycena capillaripes]